jgi:6-phosphogluconolactonase
MSVGPWQGHRYLDPIQMPAHDVQIFENLEALSRAAAARFAEIAGNHSRDKGNFSCALSGGSTPRRLYELMAEESVSWDNIHLFQVDERCVPPDDAESNYRMIREALLEKVGLPPGNFHRIAGEKEDRDAVGREYEGELARTLQPRAGEFPRMHLIFLGMGGDGHTASLFPGSKALEEKKLWVCPNFSPRLGKFRMTLTYPVLNAAEEVIFLVSGADKAETLRQVLEGPPGQFPAQGIKPANGCLRWFVDRAAAKLLSQTARNGT